MVSIGSGRKQVTGMALLFKHTWTLTDTITGDPWLTKPLLSVSKPKWPSCVRALPCRTSGMRYIQIPFLAE